MPNAPHWLDISRRHLLMAGASVASGATLAASQPLQLPQLDATAAQGRPWRLAFGSCAKQSKAQPIWQAIEAAQPHLFMFMGDNFYADAQTPELLRERYAEFMQVEALQQFRARHAHIAIWDDHDFGDDDVGGEYPHKRLSQQLFCDAWNEAAHSPRRTRDGIYQSWRLQAGGRSVQIIGLDLRFNRTALVADPQRRNGYQTMMRRAALGQAEEVSGWYMPNPDPRATMLGAAQWAWLSAQLAEPADLRILLSSVQLAAEGTGWEGWANFPEDRQRLLRLLKQHRAEGLVVLSGDMHYGEFSRLDAPGLYPIWDITSSGLTEVWAVPTPNARRTQPVLAERNFGLLDIDWTAGLLRASICDERGQARRQQQISLADLKWPRD
jgi:alkaline phosphatase D